MELMHGSSVMRPEKHHDASHDDVHPGPLLLEGSAEPLPSSLLPHPNLHLHPQLPSATNQQWRAEHGNCLSVRDLLLVIGEGD